MIFSNVLGLTILYCSIFASAWKAVRDSHFHSLSKQSRDPIERTFVAKVAKYSHFVLLGFTVIEVTNICDINFKIILLVVWQAVDPYTKSDYEISSLDLTRAHICKTEYPSTWIGLQIALFALQFIFGLGVAWDLRYIYICKLT